MKKRLSFVLIAVAATALVLGLCACGNVSASMRDSSPSRAIESDTAKDLTPTRIPRDVPKVELATTTVKVTDLFRETGTYRDPDVGEITYVFALPKVTGPDTDYIFDINMFVAKKNRDLVGPALTAKEQGGPMGYFDVEYQSQTVGSLVSILMTWRNLYDGITEYQTWLIRSDGTRAENSALFAAKGVTKEQVLAKVREQLGALVQKPDYEAIKQMAGKEMADMAMEAYEQTFSDDNINSHMPYYINDEGHLAVVATVYTIAGAGWKTYFLDLGF